MRKKEDIENVISKSRDILIKHPELKEKDIDVILEMFDDGTDENIKNRWGVAAWITIDSITKFEPKALVEQLAEITNGLIIDQYVGYILNKEYNIDLEEIILEADKIGKYNEVLNYVIDNIIFQKAFNSKYFISILQMLNKYSQDNHTLRFLYNYSEYISNFKAFQNVADLIGDVENEIQYKLMKNIASKWYNFDVNQASNMINKFISSLNIYSQKAAICFIEVGLFYNTEIFEDYFLNLQAMASEKKNLWLDIIPILIEYINKSKVRERIVSIEVLKLLQQVENDSKEAKRVFIEAYLRHDKEIDQIRKLFLRIISSPFDDNDVPFDLLGDYFHIQLNKELYDQTIQELLCVFQANFFINNYYEFFDGFDSVFHEIAHADKLIEQKVLEFMLSSDKYKVFFGIGIVKYIRDFTCKYFEKNGKEFSLSVIQLIKVLKCLLYDSIDSIKICYVAFDLLVCVHENCSKYFNFCIDEIYANYPKTFYKIASEYKETQNDNQSILAKMVIKKYEELIKSQEIVSQIKDIYPSYEHQLIYSKALNTRNKEINKKANEQSMFANVFSTRTIKYGVRNIF